MTLPFHTPIRIVTVVPLLNFWTFLRISFLESFINFVFKFIHLDHDSIYLLFHAAAEHVMIHNDRIEKVTHIEFVNKSFFVCSRNSFFWSKIYRKIFDRLWEEDFLLP